MAKKLVSIVILSWQRQADLLDGLAKIKGNDYPNLEIIVVDNGSTDGTVEAVKINFPEVKLIALKNNTGIAGYNQGFAAAQGEYILILDDDSYPAPDAISKSVAVLEPEPDTIVVAHNILNPASQKSDTLNWPREVFTFIGCGAMVRKNVFAKAGYYQSDFFLYGNETDVTIKMLAQNPEYKIKFFPDIISYHKTAANNRSGGRRVYYEIRNNLWIIWQYFSWPRVITLSFRRVFQEFIFALTWHRSPGAYFRGLLASLLGIPRYLFKLRNPVPRDLQDKILASPTLVMGEKTFSFIKNNIKNKLNK